MPVSFAKSKQEVVVTVNATMTQLYWNIGKRIKDDILHNTRAVYGKEIIATLSAQLTNEFGRGWSEKQLRHCLRIAETIQDKEILYVLSRELSWTHIRTVIYIDDPIKRDFYFEMCKSGIYWDKQT